MDQNFFNKDLTKLFQSYGIDHQSSCVETPQQNGRAERKHRHLLSVARALKFNSKVPIHLWGDCLLTATYIINKTPSKLLNNLSPYEILFHKPPLYDHMKVFGCLAYASTLSQRKDKFAPRATKCVFLGYPQHQKGYKLMNIENGHKFVSTDVVFYENVFPYSTSVSTTSKLFPSDSSFIDDLVASSSTPPLFAHNEMEHHHSPSANPSADHSHDITGNISSSDSDSSTVLPIVEQNSRPVRVKQLPVKFSDYTGLPAILNKTCASAVQYPLHLVDSVQNFTPTYQAFVANSAVIPEPLFYSQAIKDSNWCKAMQLELNALEANNTWQITSLPPGKKAVGCKWIYKVKYKSDGTLERYKGRLVAQGFTQTA